MATNVNTAALIRPVRSVLKFNNPMARPPRTTVNCSHERNVRSFAKKTKSQHMSQHPPQKLQACTAKDCFDRGGADGTALGLEIGDLLVLHGRGERYGSLETG